MDGPSAGEGLCQVAGKWQVLRRDKQARRRGETAGGTAWKCAPVPWLLYHEVPGPSPTSFCAGAHRAHVPLFKSQRSGLPFAAFDIEEGCEPPGILHEGSPWPTAPVAELARRGQGEARGCTWTPRAPAGAEGLTDIPAAQAFGPGEPFGPLALWMVGV